MTDKPSSTLKDFTFLTKLGKGSFGTVHKVRRRQDNAIYVLKQISIKNFSAKQRAEAINEVNILSKLNHKYIVKYYDSFIENNFLNIIMEYCENGDLSIYIRQQMGRPLEEAKI